MVIVGSVVGFVAKNRQENRLLRRYYLAGFGAMKSGGGVLCGGNDFRARKKQQEEFSRTGDKRELLPQVIILKIVIINKSRNILPIFRLQGGRDK